MISLHRPMPRGVYEERLPLPKEIVHRPSAMRSDKPDATRALTKVKKGALP